MEGTLGVVDSMLPSGNLENLVPNITTPQNNTEMFQSWWDAYGFNGGPNGTSSAVQESVCLKNYGRPNF